MRLVSWFFLGFGVGDGMRGGEGGVVWEWGSGLVRWCLLEDMRVGEEVNRRLSRAESYWDGVEKKAEAGEETTCTSANTNTPPLLTGLVRAPILTTLMQVASRFLLVWGIADQFPTIAIASPAYSSMLVAWSVTEVIRYGYFAVNLAYGGVPAWLTWLRYNTFFVLYPLGIGSECWLVWRSLGLAGKRFGVVGWWGLVGVLAVYVPGEFGGGGGW